MSTPKVIGPDVQPFLALGTPNQDFTQAVSVGDFI